MLGCVYFQKHSKGAISVERGVVPESLEIEQSLVNDTSAHAITIKLRHLTAEESRPEDTLTKHGETRSGLFRSSLVSAEEEENS